MPDFTMVSSPVFSPTRCVTCGGNHDPNGFIDLLVDSATLGFDQAGDPIHDPDGAIPTIGHLYLCLTCLYQAATAAGCLEPALRARLEQELATLITDLSALSDQLEAERANKLVSLADVQTLLAARRPGPKPKPAPEAA